MSEHRQTQDAPIWSFPGGIHLDDHKQESVQLAVQEMPLPQRLTIPLQQHIGQIAEATVKPGEHVLKGQMIASPSNYVSAAIHAPSSGTIVEIAEHPVAHPSALTAPCIVLDCDGKDTWVDLPAPILDYVEIDPADLRERIRTSGIVGLGGALFPTSVKVNVQHDHIDTLIINAAECEPYITCDDMLMRERPEQIIEGILILRHIVSARRVLIGIEDNKPEARAALQAILNEKSIEQISISVVPTKYPSGGEKQLIQLLTGEAVPSQGLPSEIGVLCQNVATCVAIAEAVLEGKPLISRLVTLTGAGMAKPANYRVLIGTAANELISHAGGYTPQVNQLILGGPMMGFSLSSDEVPVSKGSNCFLATSAEESPTGQATMACIRCGECVKVCPANLLPQQLYWYARARDFDKTQNQHLFDCIECGCCAHVCPSHIPLVQYYRFAKTEIWASERERQQSDLARRRHEARDARLERIKAERQARLRKKKEVLDKKGKGAADPKKAAIEAAMKRVAAKKAAQQEGAE